jgi:hypothetical protein
MNLTGGGPNPMNRRDLVGVAVMLPTTKVLLGVLLLVAFVAAPSRTSELADLSLRAMVKETTSGYARIYGDRLCPIGSHVPEETPTTRVARTDRRTNGMRDLEPARDVRRADVDRIRDDCSHSPS